MKKHTSSLYWTCQLAGWLSYGLTIIFFSYILEKKLSPIFYPRMTINLILGLIVTHLLRTAMLRFGMRPPMNTNKWWKLFFLFIFSAVLYSAIASIVFEIFKLYDASKSITNQAITPFSVQQIIADWRSERVIKRIFISLIFDTPILLIWMSVYILWHYIEFSNAEEIQKIKLESTIKELQLKTIKSQINPHFIFNALNSIRALVDENPKRSRQAITELSNILRSSFLVDKVEIAPFEKELSIVKDYLALEHIRFEDRLKIVYEIEQETLENQMPPMMLQTLVENAIKHGLGKQPGDCFIKIISKYEAGKHTLIVENTGVFKHKEESGFGLKSTRDQLNILYVGNAEFDIYDSAPNVVTAKLVIPISN